MSERPYTADATGLRLAVRLTPRANRNGSDGVKPGADGRPVLQLRVAAPPVEGAANRALLDYLSDVLKIRKSDIKILSGETARVKIVHLSGEPATLSDQVTSRLCGSNGKLS